MISSQDTQAPRWLLLPGTLCDARVFDPVMAALGTSISDAARLLPRINSASLDELVDQAISGMADRFYIIGFSLGCQVAFEIMRQYPERCLGFVLISSTARADAPDMAPVRRAMVQQFDQMGPRAFVETQLWPKYVAAPKTAREEIRRCVFDMASDTQPIDFAHQIELAIARPASLGDIAGFRGPILMINGAQDVLTPTDMGVEIVSAADLGTHEIIPDAGHFVVLEQAQLTADTIQKWYEGVGLYS